MTTPIGEIWFTQTHIAEIIELLNLQERCKDKNEPGKSTNSGLKVAFNFSPDIAPSKHDVHSAGLLREEIAKSSIAKGNTAIGMTASPNITVLDYLGIKSNLNKEVFSVIENIQRKAFLRLKSGLNQLITEMLPLFILAELRRASVQPFQCRWQLPINALRHL